MTEHRAAGASSKDQTLAMVLIGNELLSGKIFDLNSKLVIQDMCRLGGKLQAVYMVRDLLDEIADHVLLASERHDWVVTSGGVGPTHDDVTVEAVARAFDLSTETHPELERLLRAYFTSKPLTPWILKMARIPKGSQVHFDPASPVPVLQTRNVFILPGEPGLFRRKWESIRDRFRGSPVWLARVFTTQEEEDLAATLANLEKAHRVQVGSYPVYGEQDYRVQVTIEGRRERAVSKAFRSLIQAIPGESLVRQDSPRSTEVHHDQSPTPKV